MARLYKHDKAVMMLLCVMYYIINLVTPHPSMGSLAMMGWFGLFQLCFSVASWVKRGNQWLSPYIIFLITLYLFSYGQSFLFAFHLEPSRTLVGFQGITIDDIFRAQIYTAVMLAFFQIGASAYISKRDRKVNSPVMIYEGNTGALNKLKTIGWILFIISAYPYVTETINDLIISMTQGYGAIYGAGKVGLDNLSGFIADYFIPSVICLFIAYRQNRPVRIMLLSIFVLNIAAILVIGGRSNAVILISLLLVMYHYLVKPFTKKWILVGAVGAICLLQVLTYVGESRTEAGRVVDLSDMQFENNGAVDAVAEMGATMFCLIKTQELVPSLYDYRYGKSYAFAFTTIIPNLGFWDIHPAKKESNLSDWLSDALGLGYGTGFSMCAEAYANFGVLGILVFFFWGLFIANIFGRIEISTKTMDYALLAFLLILFWFFLKLPRNNFINLIRPIFFVAGPIYLYCNNFKFRRQ